MNPPPDRPAPGSPDAAPVALERDLRKVDGMPESVREIASTPWLRLCETSFTDRHGQRKSWSFASRTGTGRAVAVIAQTDEAQPRLVLVKEFRPPVGRPVLAFPAGLVDEGESLEAAALRELAEETGWRGDLLSLGPACYSSPGLTDENMHFARVRLHTEGDPAHEAEEAIEVLLWPRDELPARLTAAAEAGLGIDVKLWSFAQALC